jgi:hypothetical protein
MRFSPIWALKISQGRPFELALFDVRVTGFSQRRVSEGDNIDEARIEDPARERSAMVE